MKKKRKNEIANKYSKSCKETRREKLKGEFNKNKTLYNNASKDKEKYNKFKKFSIPLTGILIVVVILLVVLIFVFPDYSSWISLTSTFLAIVLGISISSWYFYGKLAEKSEKICEIAENGFEIGKYATCDVTDPNWINPNQTIDGFLYR